MSSLNKLLQTLENMMDTHNRLLDLGKEKRNILVSGKIDGLQNIITQESTCVDEIQKLEQQRIQLVQAFMSNKDTSGQSFTLEELLEDVDDHTKTGFNKMAKQLRKVVQEISQLNQVNQQLIQTSLSYIQFSIGMFLPKEPSIGYGPNARNRYSNLLDAKI